MIKGRCGVAAIFFSCQLLAGDMPKPKIVMNYKNQDGCSFMVSPVFYCDEKHLKEYAKAINSREPNFFFDFVLVTVLEWPEYGQRSIVVVNKKTGNVYLVPIDVYSGAPGKGSPNGRLEFGLKRNKLCILGDILVYRSIKSGRFCFYLDGERFTGYKTAYMD